MSPLQRAFSRSGLLLVLAIGHLSAGLFILNLQTGFEQISEPGVRRLTMVLFAASQSITLHQVQLKFIVGGLLLLVLIRQAWGWPTRWFTDAMGALLCLRCTLQFLLLNLLLLSPMRAGGLLLGQLVLFLPVITIAFGWLYARLDSVARQRGRTHIAFDDGRQRIGNFDYFHMAGMTLLQFEPSGATATSRLMKSLFLLHGIVMLDLVALTLSRAIGLASGSG